MGLKTNDVSELMIINEAYQERRYDDMEMLAGFFSNVLSALTGKKVSPTRLFKRPVRDYEIQRRVKEYKKWKAGH
jgi:hypothetical protein